MEDYPSIPLYRGNDISVLKKVIDPKLSIVLPRALWDNDDFRQLPDGAKLLYGIIISKIATGDDLSESGRPGCVSLTDMRAKELLGCSQRSAHEYRTRLARSGLIVKEKGKDIRGKGKGMRAVMCPKQLTDTSGTAVIVIPISLFSCDKFIELPVSVKLLYGYLFANMAAGKGLIDPMGNCYQFLSEEQIIKYCLFSGVSLKKYADILCDNEFIAGLHLETARQKSKQIDLVYIGRII